MQNLKEKLNKKLRKNGGFTLMEMLIVIAIIAILIAIAIPTFSSQLENAREAVDAANLRAAYATVMADVVAGDGTETVQVDQTQTEANWSTSVKWPENFDVTGKAPASTASSNYWTVKWDATNKKCVVS